MLPFFLRAPATLFTLRVAAARVLCAVNTYQGLTRLKRPVLSLIAASIQAQRQPLWFQHINRHIDPIADPVLINHRHQHRIACALGV